MTTTEYGYDYPIDLDGGPLLIGVAASRPDDLEVAADFFEVLASSIAFLD